MRKNKSTPERDAERFWAKVNKQGEGGCWLWMGGKVGNGYGHFYVNGKFLYAHRLAWEYLKGPIPPEMRLDHGPICHNRGCVNPDHLRLATHAENCHNMNKKNSNTSGFKGVYFSHQSIKNPWSAQIVVNKEHIYLGIYPTPEEAHAAYCAAAIKYHGEFANFG